MIIIEQNTKRQRKVMAIDFEMVEHTADLQLHIYGNTLAELFRHAIIGMFQSIEPQAQGCHKKNERIHCPELPIKRQVRLQSDDTESLLVDFLSHALYLSDVNDEAYFDVDIESISPTVVQATLKGVQIVGMEVVEIKAVTYHDLQVKQRDDGSWFANVVFDI